MRVRQKLIKLALGTVMGLLVIEVFLQVVPRRLMPKEYNILDRAYSGRVKWQEMMTGDEYLGYHYKPGLKVSFPSEGRKIEIKTTNHGLGDIGFRDIGTQAPFDAITLGDSFTFCDDVSAETCWVTKLGEASGLSIATLGVSGYSTLAEARMLERYGQKLKPRLVIVAIFPNDFNDNIDFDEWQGSGTANFWKWRGQREGRGPVFRWLADHSKVLRIVDGVFRTRGRYIYQYKTDQLDFVFQRWWLEPMDAEREKQRAQGWALMRKALLEMNATAKANGAKLVVVTIPTKEEVYFEKVRGGLPQGDQLVVDRPYGVVTDFCQGEGITCCDTTPVLKQRAMEGEQLYLRVSSHWNEKGNAVGAEAISRCLAEQGLTGPVAPPAVAVPES